MPYSVYREGAYWDIVVSRPVASRPLTSVWLRRNGNRSLLCQVGRDVRFGWTTIVVGQRLTGPRMVSGFKTRWQAIEYAIQVRPDCNPQAEGA